MDRERAGILIKEKKIALWSGSQFPHLHKCSLHTLIRRPLSPLEIRVKLGKNEISVNSTAHLKNQHSSF